MNTGGTAADQIDLTDRDAVNASGIAGSSLFALPSLTIYGHSADTLTIDESGLNDAGAHARAPKHHDRTGHRDGRHRGNEEFRCPIGISRSNKHQ